MRPALRPLLSAEQAVAAGRGDVGLVAWLASQPDTKRRSDVEEANTWNDEGQSNMTDGRLDSIDEVFALLTSG